jgi:isoaspartyl peptidase/L-asparaginase-like protein (Ntn-hydrolase superfamily)
MKLHTSFGQLEIVNTSDFLSACRALQTNQCKVIYGPHGGLLSIDKNGALVYDCNKESIYFGVDCFLGQWRWLN